MTEQKTETVGKLIRQTRENVAKMSKERFAKLLGLPLEKLERIEAEEEWADDATIQKIVRIAWGRTTYPKIVVEKALALLRQANIRGQLGIKSALDKAPESPDKIMAGLFLPDNLVEAILAKTEAQGVTLKTLAAKANIHPVTLAKYLVQEWPITKESLSEIAKVLNAPGKTWLAAAGFWPHQEVLVGTEAGEQLAPYITIEVYTEAVRKLFQAATIHCGTSGGKVAALVLLSAYSGEEWRLSLPDLGLLNYELYIAAIIVIRARTEHNMEPHTLIENGESLFRELCESYRHLAFKVKG